MVDVDEVDVDEVAGAGSAEADEVAGEEIDGSGIRHREAETVTGSVGREGQGHQGPRPAVPRW